MALITVLGGGSGLWGWLTVRSKGKTDLVKVAQDAAASVIQDQRDEIDRVSQRLTDVERRFLLLQEEHNALMLANQTLTHTNGLLLQEKQRLVGELSIANGRAEQLAQELRQYKQLLDSANKSQTPLSPARLDDADGTTE